jgi:fimbrial chaperone protein
MKNIYFFFFLLIGSLPALAFKFEPMVVDFKPEGAGSSQVFKVENENKEHVAVKVEAFIRQIDRNGVETRIPTDHFKIFPSQLSLKGKDSRSVRITYQGPKHLTGEVAYRIVASQLPVDFEKKIKQSGVQFIFRFLASVYVTTDAFIPQLQVESVKKIDNKNTQVVLTNIGQKHRQLKGVKVILKDKTGKSLSLNEAVIKNWNAENILAGETRDYIFSNNQLDYQKNGSAIEIKDEL